MKRPAYAQQADAGLTNALRQLATAERQMKQTGVAMNATTPGTLDREVAQRRHDQASRYHGLVLRTVCSTPALTEEGRIAKARLLQSVGKHRFEDGMPADADPFAMVAYSLSFDIARAAQPAC